MQAAAPKPASCAWPRRLALLACLAALPALAGCGGNEAPPQTFAPLDYGYLTKLRLNVASIEIDNTWTPPADSGQHVEYLSPVQPIDALSTMARQRLVASGNSGRARFVVEDASIVQQPGSLYGSLAVRLDVSTSDGLRSGFAEARVARSQPEDPDATDGGRATAYELVKRMMDDMNVEFEFQVRRSLRDYLQTTAGSAPVPPPVEAQPLPPPPGATAAPAPPGSTPAGSTPAGSTPLSPPPSALAPPPSSGPIPLSPPPGVLAPTPPPPPSALAPPLSTPGY